MFGKSGLWGWLGFGGDYDLACSNQAVNFDRDHDLSIQEVSGRGNLEASSTVNHPTGNSRKEMGSLLDLASLSLLVPRSWLAISCGIFGCALPPPRCR
jgi:hypothetical protein